LKKTAAISILTLLLFNWFGYSLLSAYFEEKADARLEASLDSNNYDSSQLLTLKIPVNHLSYYNSSRQFERIDGEIEINGIQYKYVGKRLYNDSLEFLCIPNQEGMKWETAKAEFFQLVNDLQHPGAGQGKKSDTHQKNTRSFLTVYDLGPAALSLISRSSRGEYHLLPDPSQLIPGHTATAEQPPEAC
jgi:hypothetical protein